MDTNSIATCVIDRAVEIHRQIGPGHRTSVYATSLADALAERGFTVERQESLPIQLRGKRLIGPLERLSLLTEQFSWS